MKITDTQRREGTCEAVAFEDSSESKTKPVAVARSPVRDEAARARTIATRERADAIRGSLEGRQHGDSAELVAEDRRR